jgi:glycosyltransferase involved in cell wall biosynthesis
LNSVQIQDCNFEVIIVDDGSTDGSANIIKEYTKKDKRFKYIYQSAYGVSKARNVGIKYASGKYCAFIDSDDYIINDYCKTVLQQIENYEILVFGQKAFDEYSNRIDVRFRPRDEIFLENRVFPAFTKRRFGYPIWNKIYKTSLLKTVRFRNIAAHEDELFGVEVFAQAKNVKMIDYVGYMYRQRNGSLTKIQSQKNIRGILSVTNVSNMVFRKYSLESLFDKECELLRKAFLQSTLKHLKNYTILENDENYLQFALLKKLAINDDLLNEGLQIVQQKENKTEGQLEDFNKKITSLKQEINKTKQNKILKDTQRDLIQIQQEKTKANNINNEDTILLSNKREIFKLKQVIQQMEQENEKLKQSKSFQLGNLFFRSVDSPYKIMTFPINFVRILIKK